jgi:starch synthase (maltosyl-transferring)
MYWIEQGVTIFRVDNPHTKPFVFWEWLIKEVNKKYNNIFFLSEAFTRPKIMAKLAKIGFTQSYSYFTWRVTKSEIIGYMNELTQSDLREYFRPNFWPNTPDILPFHLHNKGYAASAMRFLLAATLSSNYGMYGPVFDLLETEPFNGKEEYNNSEKYEIRNWDWTTMTPMRKLIKLMNAIRNKYEAFQTTYNIEFVDNDNPMLLSFIKHANDKSKSLFIVINLDDNFKQSGHTKFDAEKFGKKAGLVKVNDLLNGESYDWKTDWNYVELDPQILPAHIFEIL